MSVAKYLFPLGLLAVALGAAGSTRRRKKGIVMEPIDITPGDEPRDPYVPDPLDPIDWGASVDPGIDEPILDRIAEGEAALAAREKRSGKRISKGRRDMGLVDGLVLHQMSFQRGNDPERYFGVTAHYIILPNGQIVQLHHEDEYLNAANNFNRYTISVEFAGNFPNASGNWWKGDKFGRDQVTQEQIAAGRYLIDHLRNRLPQIGSPGLAYVYAHRQSDDQKGNDPGPDIWYHVGEWALRNRGLEESPTGDPDFAVGDGRPIPDSWRRPSSNAIA